MPQMPRQEPTVRSLKKEIEELRLAVRALQSRTDPVDNPQVHSRETIFSYHGEVLSDDPSGHYLIKDFAATIHRMDYCARVAATVETTWQIMVNNVVVYTYIVPPGTYVDNIESLSLDVEEWDRLSVNCPTVFSGQETVVLTFYVTAVDGSEYT